MGKWKLKKLSHPNALNSYLLDAIMLFYEFTINCINPANIRKMHLASVTTERNDQNQPKIAINSQFYLF